MPANTRTFALILAIVVILAITLGYATYGPEQPQQPAKVGEPLAPALATAEDVSLVAARVQALERKAGTAAAAADIAQVRAEIDRLKRAVEALAGGERSRARSLVTGSVK